MLNDEYDVVDVDDDDDDDDDVDVGADADNDDDNDNHPRPSCSRQQLRQSQNLSCFKNFMITKVRPIVF